MQGRRREGGERRGPEPEAGAGAVRAVANRDDVPVFDGEKDGLFVLYVEQPGLHLLERNPAVVVNVDHLPRPARAHSAAPSAHATRRAR